MTQATKSKDSIKRAKTSHSTKDLQPDKTKFADVFDFDDGIKNDGKPKRAKDEGIAEEDFIQNELGIDNMSNYEVLNILYLLREQASFYIHYSLQDVMRRKILFLIAFSAVFVSILATLLIDVFVQKGSLIFIKMSQDA